MEEKQDKKGKTLGELIWEHFGCFEEPSISLEDCEGEPREIGLEDLNKDARKKVLEELNECTRKKILEELNKN